METGIVGLPLSGKTTLFNLLTRSGAETGFAAGKKAVNLGQSQVPDPRLDRLSEMWQPKKTTPAIIRYVDVAGVEKGAGEGGLPADFLAPLKNTDALLVVVRAFESDQIPHPEGSVDPLRDLETLQGEFLISDLIIVENRLKRLEKQLKAKVDRELELERGALETCLKALEAETPLREVALDPADEKRLRGFQFLTLKPMVVALNLGEDDVSRSDEVATTVVDRWEGPHVTVTTLCATIEQEISELSPDDARDFIDDLGLETPATDRLLRVTYRLLGLISFFTMGEDECRAWTIRRGTKAPQAAGTIHTDLERGFIRAEVVAYDAFIEAGSQAACRDRGTLRVEGKGYVVVDGDILNIRFNV